MDSIMVEKTKIALITGNWDKENKSIAGTFVKLLKIISPLSGEVVCIFANHSIEISDSHINYIKLDYNYFEKSFLKSSLYFILYQLKVTLTVIRLIKSNRVDIFIFCFGADLFFLPIMIGRFFGKKVIIRTDSRPSISTQYYKGHKNKIQFRRFLFKSIEEITYYLANNIIPESPFMVQFYDFSKYNPKVCIDHLYIENLFKINKKLDERKYNVGYVGRFSDVKGVLEFAQSLHILQIRNSNIEVLFVGDGELRNKVEELAYASNMQATFVGWIEKEKIPAYLNDVKLLVFPSAVEGLPNSILEAMACGSIVISTRIGGVPDVIKDCETGFIMENNSPACIAENVMRALKHPNLEMIVEKARAMVEREFTYEAAVERWKEILEEL